MFDRKEIKQTYIRLSNQIKDFLLSPKSKEFLIFLGFFLVAGAFWLLQTLNDDYETEFNIPLRLRNVPDNVVLTIEPPSQLRVLVKDKGTVLLNRKVSKSFFPITLDFNDYQGTNNYVRIPSSDLEKKIQSQLGSPRLLSIKPDTLEYIYTTGQSKRVPVVLTGKISAGRQYYIADTIIRPDSVTVYAPSRMLDTIKVAYTDYVHLTDISDTVAHLARLRTLRGAKYIPDQVSLRFPVDVFTEKTVEVPVIGTRFPSDRVLKAFPSKVKVTFQIGLSRFNTVTAEDFVISAPYSELLRVPQSEKYRLKLEIYPRGINNIRISPEQVDFLIETVALDGTN
ncbi:MAG: YbbR-like domain-containing protein [Bacteroides sp.]|nr:YbbR-like domain-containing protein [Bacteroides sp.]